MPRKPLAIVAPPAPPSATPASPSVLRTLDLRAVGTLAEWGQYLGLPRNCLKREARLSRLRVAKRAGKLWSTGLWIKQWIEDGEIRRRAREASDAQ
jgi:hypothetical protein